VVRRRGRRRWQQEQFSVCADKVYILFNELKNYSGNQKIRPKKWKNRTEL
jgi:hypothetical protein